MSVLRIPCALLLLAISPLAWAENEWSEKGSTERPAISAENRIVKWCADDGDGIRYASANLDHLKGYHPCGKVETKATCDPAGQRHIGKGDSPHGYLDCNIGPRMEIITHSEPKEDEKYGDGHPEPMATKERRELKKELEALVKNQDPLLNMQQSLMPTLEHLKSMISSLPKDEKKRQLEQSKPIFELILTLDPGARPMLEDIFGKRAVRDVLGRR